MEKRFLKISQGTWRAALGDKALQFRSIPYSTLTRGYWIVWYLWSADIWFNRFPLLKFIVLANIVVWIILFVIGR